MAGQTSCADSVGGRAPLPHAGSRRDDPVSPSSPEDRARERDEEMTRALRELGRTQEKMAQQYSQAARVSEGDDMAITDKINAISGFEFKQNLPVIKDTDLFLSGIFENFTP